MNNQQQNKKEAVPEQIQEQQSATIQEPIKKPKPKWLIPVIVVVGVIIIGLAAYGVYGLIKSIPEEDTIAPEIISTEPAEESTLEIINIIKITFDEGLDINTVNIDNVYPLWGIQDKVPGKVSYDETKNQIIFEPEQPIIAQNTTQREAITMVITKNIKDKSGNSLKEQKTYNIYLLKDETADWKVFNNIYGYQIKYPQNFEIFSNSYGKDPYEAANIAVMDSDAELVFDPKDNNSFYKRFYIDIREGALESGQSLLDFAQETYGLNQAEGYTSSELTKKEYKEYGGVVGYEFNFNHGFVSKFGRFLIYPEMKVIYFLRNSDLYRISFPFNDQIFEQILSTFKFLD